MNTIDPRGMKVMDWVDSTLDLLGGFLPFMKIERDDQWKEWGNLVRQSLRRDGILIPDPNVFVDWEEWAMRFNQVIAPVRS